MSFFQRLGEAFGLGGSTRSVARMAGQAAQGVVRQNLTNAQLAGSFLPTTTIQSQNRDQALFQGGLEQATSRELIQGLFTEETGEAILSPGQPGYDAQRARLGGFIKERQKDIDTGLEQMRANTNQQRAQRLLNQTGGVRNGMARNPFNMNMLRGPQMDGAPARQAPSGATGGGGPAGQRASQYMMR